MRLAPLILLAPLALVGCAKGPVKPDPAAVQSLRDRYVLDAEPADAVTPLDWRDEQQAEGAEPAAEVTLVGTVGGMPNPWGADNEPDFPWKKGQATFFLVDPSTVEEFADHAAAEGVEHAEDCPFCSREAANKTSSVAVVTFPAPDNPGKPAAIDTRDLFDLEKGDLVVVHGRWSLKGDVLFIDADGLYVRQ